MICRKSCLLLAVMALLSFSCSEEETIDRALSSENEKGKETTHSGAPEKLSEDMTYDMVVIFDLETADRLAEDVEEGVLEGQAISKAFAATKAASMARLDIVRMERVFPDAGEYEGLHRKEGLHKFYRVTYSKPVAKETAEAELSGVPAVEKAEAPTPKKLCAVNVPFNDPYAKSYQWQYYNDGSLYSKFVNGCDINVVPVWQNYTGGTSNVIVSIVDEGIDASHEDLGAVMVPAGSNGSKNFATTSSKAYTITPGEHGCHVAGIVGAINNNGKGVCGVAGGLDGKGGVKLMSCQIFGDRSGDSAAAIVWGADHGAVISQNSWGYDFDSNDDGQLTGSEATRARSATIDSSDKAAVDYFIKYAGCDAQGNQRSDSPMKGGIVIFAAGNDNFENGAPANYEPVVAVGAIGPDARRASYSNYGSWVDICAPGGEYDRFSSVSVGKNGTSYILSCSTVSDGGYTFMCGTSMACPMVSGVAALVVSYFGGPGFTNTQLKSMILDNANYTIIPTSDKIGPLVDAYEIFKKNLTPNGNPEISTTYKGDYTVRVGGSLAVDFTASDPDDDVCTFTLEGGDGSATLTSTGNNKCRITINTAIKYVGTHKATLKAEDGNGGSAAYPLEYTVLATSNPVISTDYTGDYTVRVGSSLAIDFTASDPDGDICTFTLEGGDGSASLASTGENKCRITIDSSEKNIGSHSATLKAVDGNGGSGTYALSYTVVSIYSPTITTDYTGDYSVRVGKELEIIYTVTDSDSDNVNVTLQSDGSATLTPMGGGQYKFAVNTQQTYAGSHTAIIKADDGETTPAKLIVNYRIIANKKPVISTTYDGSYTLITGCGPINIDYSVTDPDGDVCTVSYDGDGSATFTKTGEGSYRLSILDNEAYAGPHTGLITANDGFGGTATKSVAYTVKVNHAPKIAQEGSFDPEIAVGQYIKAYFKVSDEDGDELTVSLSGDGSATLNHPDTYDYNLSFNATSGNVGSHTAKLTVSDPYGLKADISVSYTIYVNRPPVITMNYDGANPLKWYETGSLSIKAEDPEGKPGMSFEVKSGNAVSTPTVSGNTATVNIGDGKGKFVGACTIVATATDWLGETSSKTFTYTVLANRAPLPASAIEDAYLDRTKGDVTIDLSGAFKDPDLENLTLTAKAGDGSIASVETSGSTIRLKGLKNGVTDITVTATDGLGLSCSSTFKVGSFDLSGGPVIAPNPVRDNMTIRLGEKTDVNVRIYSESNKLVKEENGTSSVFEPMTVNAWSLAPGRYTVHITYGGNTYKRSITKI
ncbi:MAG: S8 family serine peptidase [Bacteroidales bacterium]|nr:S8 family serine peptidase [Bacteroidales bacterium]